MTARPPLARTYAFGRGEKPPHKEMRPPLAGPRPSPWAHAAGSHLTREQAPRGREPLAEASADGRVEEDEEEEELAKESRRVWEGAVETPSRSQSYRDLAAIRDRRAESIAGLGPLQALSPPYIGSLGPSEAFCFLPRRGPRVGD